MGAQERENQEKRRKEKELQAPGGMKWRADSKAPREAEKRGNGMGGRREMMGSRLQGGCALGPNFRHRKGLK